MTLIPWLVTQRRWIYWMILIYGILIALLVKGTGGQSENPFLYERF